MYMWCTCELHVVRMRTCETIPVSSYIPRPSNRCTFVTCARHKQSCTGTRKWVRVWTPGRLNNPPVITRLKERVPFCAGWIEIWCRQRFETVRSQGHRLSVDGDKSLDVFGQRRATQVTVLESVWTACPTSKSTGVRANQQRDWMCWVEDTWEAVTRGMVHMCFTCELHVFHMCFACELNVCHMWLACVSHANCMSLHVNCMCFACELQVGSHVRLEITYLLTLVGLKSGLVLLLVAVANPPGDSKWSDHVYRLFRIVRRIKHDR